MERNAVNRILHLATNAASLGTLHSLDSLVGVRLKPLQIVLQSCMLRAAHSTLTNVDNLYQQLIDSAIDNSRLSSWSSPVWSPPGWDSTAFVVAARNSLCFRNISHDALNSCSLALNKWLQSHHKSLQQLFLLPLLSIMAQIGPLFLLAGLEFSLRGSLGMSLRLGFSSKLGFCP